MTAFPESLPIVISSASQMRDWSTETRCAGHRVALVPTMGALHEGHLALVREARKHADRVVVSIFVNPTQFGPNEDFEAYPRTLESDLQALGADRCCDVVYAPTVQEMYPVGENVTWVTVDRMGDHLCGAARPGHFRGVTTVVSKLFNMVMPQVAVFGLKDAQQFFILNRMTVEMGFGIELIGLPTVRESDGLAMSSRNRYLTATERAAAPLLNALLQEARYKVEAGERNARTLTSIIRAQIESESSCTVDYVQFVDTTDLQPIESLEPGSRVLLALAAFFGKARLIDNVLIDVPVD
ncbi:MAG: pantoate--beta-alanine ligase [Bacteroidota bacterium]|nr:pantoate--beta-alanine ligase [Bacteroidota bacterium]